MTKQRQFDKSTLLLSEYDLDIIEKFTDDEVGKITKALHKYQKNGFITSFDPNGRVWAAFEFMKNRLDIYNKKYEEKKNNANSLGGKISAIKRRPEYKKLKTDEERERYYEIEKAKIKQEDEQNEDTSTDLSSPEDTSTKVKCPNEIEVIYDICKDDICKDDINVIPVICKKEIINAKAFICQNSAVGEIPTQPTEAESLDLLGKTEDKTAETPSQQPTTPSTKPTPKPDFSKEMLEIYNQTCQKLPRATQLTQTRKLKLNGLINNRNYRDKDGKPVFENLNDWKTYCEIANESPFLTGAGNRGWRADIDFLLNPSKIVKIIEGSYDFQSKKAINN